MAKKTVFKDLKKGARLKYGGRVCEKVDRNRVVALDKSGTFHIKDDFEVLETALISEGPKDDKADKKDKSDKKDKDDKDGKKPE